MNSPVQNILKLLNGLTFYLETSYLQPCAQSSVASYIQWTLEQELKNR